MRRWLKKLTSKIKSLRIFKRTMKLSSSQKSGLPKCLYSTGDQASCQRRLPSRMKSSRLFKPSKSCSCISNAPLMLQQTLLQAVKRVPAAKRGPAPKTTQNQKNKTIKRWWPRRASRLGKTATDTAAQTSRYTLATAEVCLLTVNRDRYFIQCSKEVFG